MPTKIPNKLGDTPIAERQADSLKSNNEHIKTSLADVIEITRKYAKDNGYENNFTRGFNKTVPSAFNFDVFNRNLKLLYKSIIAESIEAGDDKSFIILKDYVDATSAIDGLLTHIKFNSDNKAILLDIISYILKYLDKTYD